MPDPKHDPRRAYASAPVNSRTAPKAAPKPQPLHAAVRARAQKARQRQLLGASMSDLVGRRTAGVARQHGDLHPGVIGATVCAVAAASALVLMRSGTGLALASALTALGGVCWLWHQRSQRLAKEARRLTTPEPAGPPPFDAEALRRIDEAFEATAAVASGPALALLITLKAAAVRMALAVGRSGPDADFTLEDRMYVIECIRRYIPDTLTAYLQVPPAQRSLPGPQASKTADLILLDQLSLLQTELEHREQRLQGSAVEPLLRQQRFLESKATRG